MKNRVNQEKFNEYPIFEKLDSKEIQDFTNRMEINNYSKDEIKEGDDGHSILFLINGEISISQALTLPTNKYEELDNREKELIKLNSENDTMSLGEISLFNIDKKRTATAKATTQCKIARLSFEDLFEICNNNKDIGYKVMINISKIITKHLIDSNHKVLKLTTAFSLLIDS
jgi:CRP-like cAMP-binding protein